MADGLATCLAFFNENTDSETLFVTEFWKTDKTVKSGLFQFTASIHSAITRDS